MFLILFCKAGRTVCAMTFNPCLLAANLIQNNVVNMETHCPHCRRWPFSCSPEKKADIPNEFSGWKLCAYRGGAKNVLLLWESYLNAQQNCNILIVVLCVGAQWPFCCSPQEKAADVADAVQAGNCEWRGGNKVFLRLWEADFNAETKL